MKISYSTHPGSDRFTVKRIYTTDAFVPIAVESLGAWHKCAIKEIKKLGSAKARHIGEEESVEVQRLFQKLSVALMRGNCALMTDFKLMVAQQSGKGPNLKVVKWW